MTAVAIVTEAVRPGVVFANFLHPRWSGAAANSMVHRVPDPVTNRYRFKLGKGVVTPARRVSLQEFVYRDDLQVTSDSVVSLTRVPVKGDSRTAPTARGIGDLWDVTC